jgi:hypothetical protein
LHEVAGPRRNVVSDWKSLVMSIMILFS